MSLIVHDQMEQGSDAWLDARLGLVTASTIGALLTINPPSALDYDCPTCHSAPAEDCTSMAKGGEGKTVKTVHGPRATIAAENPDRLPDRITVADNDTSHSFTAQLVSERLCGWSDPIYVNRDMERGNQVEPIARDYYAEHTKANVEEVGFLVRTLPSGSRVGWSPDGLIDGLAGIEIKGPSARNHLMTILSGEVPKKHLSQIHCGLFVSDREWVDFCSFYGGLKPFIKRVYRDANWDAAITAAVDNFERTADQMVAHYEAATADLAPTERLLADMEMSL